MSSASRIVATWRTDGPRGLMDSDRALPEVLVPILVARCPNCFGFSTKSRVFARTGRRLIRVLIALLGQPEASQRNVAGRAKDQALLSALRPATNSFPLAGRLRWRRRVLARGARALRLRTFSPVREVLRRGLLLREDWAQRRVATFRSLRRRNLDQR